MCSKLSSFYGINKWLMLVLISTFLAACGDDGRDPILGNKGNVALSPTVTAVTPVNNATNVAVTGAQVTAQFSQAVNPLTISTFTLTCAGSCTSPSGTITMNGASNVATFNVTNPAVLSESTVYTATIHSATSSVNGLALANPYTWSFTTGLIPDTTLPRITATDPDTTSPGPTANVQVDTAIAAVFSEDMLATTINNNSFTVTCAAPCAAPTGEVSYDAGSRSAIFTAEQNLQYQTTYTATVASSVTDLAGNELAGNQGSATTASDYEWQFTTGVAPDTIMPRVTATVPLTTVPGPTPGTPVNTLVSAEFSEDMLASTITDGTFTVTCAAPCVAPIGEVSYDVGSRSATFTAAQNFQYQTTYTATVASSVTDLAGNELAGNQGSATTASNYRWQFTTGVAPDTTMPRITATVPLTTVPGPTPETPVNTLISAEFSEDMLASTITNGTFTVTCAAPCVSPSGDVSYETASATAVFSPDESLEGETTYTATMSSSVTDLAGNELAGNQGTVNEASDYVWQFTTGLTPDTTRPRVTLTEPVTTTPGPTENVEVDTAIAAVFSEDMLASTITGGTFTVTCAAPCAAPTGGVSYDVESRSATFTAAQNLEYETTYTATVASSVTDLAGNELAGNQGSATTASDYEWQFTTSVAPDTIMPRITATVPLTTVPGPTPGTPVNTLISAEFSEDMLASTITDATFTVICEAPCVAPSGSVSYETASATAVFSPDENLEWETTYTATMSSSVTDLAGNELAGNQGSVTEASDYVWQFTTGLTPDITRPRVTLTEPLTTTPGPTENVPVNTAITAVFSEDMLPASVTDTSFTVTCETPCVSPVGEVTYVVGSRSAVFNPDQNLEESTTYTATLTSSITDVAGNELAGNQGPANAASDYVWMFTTVAPMPVNTISIMETDPLNAGMLAVCPNASINATFEIPSGTRLNPNTVNDMTFLITEDADPLNTVTAESIEIDVDTGTIITFIPQQQLDEDVTYRATVVGGVDGVKDLMVPGNEMLEDYVWTFTTVPATESCLQPVDLQSAAPFGTFGGTAGVTNQGLLTVINGDLGTTAVSTMVTGFVSGPGCEYTITPLNEGQVNGNIFTSPPPPTVACPQDGTAETAAIASQARLDAQTAYLELTPANLPGGQNPGNENLGGLTLAPGIYRAQSGAFMIQGSDLTLDGQGNQNAVFVFQMATTLTVGGPGANFPQSVILINGAQAKNIFWQVGSAATINAAGGGTMKGTIIAQEGVSISTAGNVNIVTLDGRALSLGASVTVVNTVINVPAE